MQLDERDPTTRTQMAQAIAQGILGYFQAND
jgi:N-acetylmuramoyl-L-alanine amidase